MTSGRILYWVLIFAILVLPGCDGESACDGDEPAQCGEDAAKRVTCESGRWKVTECEEGRRCVHTVEGAVCLPVGPDAERCVPGTTQCSSKGLIQTCSQDAEWVFTVCANGGTCVDGACVGGTLPGDAAHVIARRCGVDGRSIDDVYVDRVKNTSCLELIGFDTACETYRYGLVGCAWPLACNDTFSEGGTCIGNTLAFCDMAYLQPRPGVVDCTALGGICATLHYKARCTRTCEAPFASPICVSAAGVSRVERCVAHGEGHVVESGTMLCLDETTSATCDGQDVIQARCDAGEKCLAELGYCTQVCTAGAEGSLRCFEGLTVLGTPFARLQQCQALAGGGFAFVDVGSRHCLDDETLAICAKNDDEYKIREVDCGNYVKEDEIIRARCVMDYGGYPDYDVCFPRTIGEPCGDITEAGVCVWNVLHVCDEPDDAIWKQTCARSQDGFTQCSTYLGFADCRQPCKNAGAAVCQPGGDDSFYLELCVPDDADKNTLSIVQGQAICYGDKLYSCLGNGSTSVVDCSLGGGRCDIGACVYPACMIDRTPMCFGPEGDAMLVCQVGSNGVMEGIEQRSIHCDAQGNCQVCVDGALTPWP